PEVQSEIAAEADVIVGVSGKLEESHWIAGRARTALAEHVRSLVSEERFELVVFVIPSDALNEVIRRDHVDEVAAHLDGVPSRDLHDVVGNLEEVLDGTGRTDRPPTQAVQLIDLEHRKGVEAWIGLRRSGQLVEVAAEGGAELVLQRRTEI